MKSRVLSASFVLVSVLVSAAGCAAPSDDAPESAELELTSKLSAAELASTKQALRAIALANIDRMDNWPAVRAQLDPLVAKLARHFGKRTALQKVPLVKGAWRQIWSDFPYPGPSFITMDPRQVYQVVTDEGYYYNLGDNRAIGFVGLTGVLRGSYTTDGPRLRVQFTKSGFRFGTLDEDEDLYGLALGLESGDRLSLSFPGGGRAPRGPVGISGTLETLYVDQDLRIDVGTQTDFVDERGEVLVPGVGPKLFVLDRVTTPAK